MTVNWQGVLPAITTPFTQDLELDLPRVEEPALAARRRLRRSDSVRFARRERNADAR